MALKKFLTRAKLMRLLRRRPTTDVQNNPMTQSLPMPNAQFFSAPIQLDINFDPITQNNQNNAEPEKVVDKQEVQQAERRIWGLFVMQISHYTGLHPIRAPFFCTEEQCVKLSVRQRLSVIDIVMWTINFFTCLNHIYIRFILPGFVNVWVKPNSVQLLRECITAFYPFFVLIITLVNSSGLDQLLHLLSQSKQEISKSNNNKRIKRWRILMFVLNGLFLGAFIANFLMIISHNLLSDDDDDTDPLYSSTHQTPSFSLQCFSSPTSMLVCFDDAYYEVMSFCVGEIPRIFIMMMAIEVGFLFKENAAIVHGKRLTVNRLTDFHENFQKSTTILDQLEQTFNKLILFVVCITVATMSLNFYVILEYLTTMHQGSETSTSSPISSTSLPSTSPFTFNKALALLFNVQEPNEQHPLQQKMWVLVLFVESANFCLKMSWTLGFIVACVWCNDQSRAALPGLLSQLALGDAKPLKDQLVQRLQDFSWGITMAKFMRMERTVLITIVSIAFTVVMVWIQITTTVK